MRISAQKASEILGISKPTVIKLIRSGKIDAVRIGNVYKIEVSEVERVRKDGTEQSG